MLFSHPDTLNTQITRFCSLRSSSGRNVVTLTFDNLIHSTVYEIDMIESHIQILKRNFADCYKIGGGTLD